MQSACTPRSDSSCPDMVVERLNATPTVRISSVWPVKSESPSATAGDAFLSSDRLIYRPSIMMMIEGVRRSAIGDRAATLHWFVWLNPFEWLRRIKYLGMYSGPFAKVVALSIYFLEILSFGPLWHDSLPRQQCKGRGHMSQIMHLLPTESCRAVGFQSFFASIEIMPRCDLVVLQKIAMETAWFSGRSY